jgi:Ala-tRNA(Pro) deacylase
VTAIASHRDENGEAHVEGVNGMNDRLRTALGRAGATFEVMLHPEAYTAQERAAASHVRGQCLAKVVVVRDGDWFGLAVVPATAVLDVDGLRVLTGRRRLTLAREKDFAPLFPDCEPGAMPPFGHLYGMTAFLDTALADEPELVFEGGTHREEIRMSMNEYLRVERPAIAAVAAPLHAAV